jgi:hypothetical protein
MIGLQDVFNQLGPLISMMAPAIGIAVGFSCINLLVKMIRDDSRNDPRAWEREQAKLRAEAEVARRKEEKRKIDQQLARPVDSRLVNAIAVIEYVRSLFIPGSCPKCGAPNPEHKLACQYCGRHF